MTQLAANQVTEVTISAVVIRANGKREDLGDISYWHRNPIRRWLRKARKIINGFARH